MKERIVNSFFGSKFVVLSLDCIDGLKTSRVRRRQQWRRLEKGKVLENRHNNFILVCCSLLRLTKRKIRRINDIFHSSKGERRF